MTLAETRIRRFRRLRARYPYPISATLSDRPTKKMPRKSPLARLGLFLAAVLCLIAAPVAGYFTVVRFMAASASVNWPTAEATIIESSVHEWRNAKRPSYEPKVRYRYQVEERERIGTAISANDVGYGSRDEATAIVNRYPAGSKHSVHYDPNDATNAFLEPGVTGRTYFFFLIPLMLLVTAVILFFAARA
jgi:hypothetical protein